MIHALRFCRIAPGGLEDLPDHAGNVAPSFRGDRYSSQLGLRSCGVGAVDGIAHLRRRGISIEAIASEPSMPPGHTPMR